MNQENVSLTAFAHQWILKNATNFQFAVDATCGNGLDSVFLAKNTTGKLFCFDIQEEAIQNTKAKLLQNHLHCQYQLIHDSHENIKQYIDTLSIDVAMMNLGYLPHGDHSITTTHTSTMKALDEIHKQLKGVMTILCYPGHAQGKIETQAVAKWIATLDSKQWTIETKRALHPDSPILYCLKKTCVDL
ncbi:MAG: class I SAM-dependent methyltransferase [Bdellovibrionales bacterium]|nr:class I SAM-dependent methyltransferase [Bdellovibrionales bacterium]